MADLMLTSQSAPVSRQPSAAAAVSPGSGPTSPSSLVHIANLIADLNQPTSSREELYEVSQRQHRQHCNSSLILALAA